MISQAAPETLASKVERVKLHAIKSLEGNLEGDSVDRFVSVYLPPSYAASPKRRYPDKHRRAQISLAGNTLELQGFAGLNPMSLDDVRHP